VYVVFIVPGYEAMATNAMFTDVTTTTLLPKQQNMKLHPKHHWDITEK
jgi:hypothetical protein